MTFFPWQIVLCTPMPMTPLCTIPRPLTDVQIHRNCKYQGTILQTAWPQTFLSFPIGARETLFLLMLRKLKFLMYQLDKIFHTTIPYSSATQLSPSSILNSLGLSFKYLNWKFHISSLAISDSSRLGVMYRLQQFPLPINCFHYARALSALVWSMHAMCGEVQHILQLSSDPFLLLAVFYLSNSAAMLLLSQSSIAIFMLTALLNLLTACHPPPFSRPRFTRLSTSSLMYCPLMQEWTRTSIPSSLSLVNCGTASLLLYFLLPATRTPSRGECQGTSAT